jgi:hypothetical protein
VLTVEIDGNFGRGRNDAQERGGRESEIKRDS